MTQHCSDAQGSIFPVPAFKIFKQCYNTKAAFHIDCAPLLVLLRILLPLFSLSLPNIVWALAPLLGFESSQGAVAEKVVCVGRPVWLY